MSNRQADTELFISIKTVQFHLTHIHAKLGINTRASASATNTQPRKGGWTR